MDNNPRNACNVPIYISAMLHYVFMWQDLLSTYYYEIKILNSFENS